MAGMNRRHVLAGGAALSAFLPMVSACAPSRAGSATGPDETMDGTRMAQLIAAGEISALDTVNAAIDRAIAVEPQINAIATETYDAARAEALLGPTGTLAGVPSFTKDLNDRLGEPTLFGSRAFRGYIAPEDAPISAAWRRAGIVSLGKSTTPEMGLTSTTEPQVTGATRNPWNLDHIVGGSSGGAAALVAARVVPFAHANDGGGSIRIPASCCGLFGLKPSRQRLHGRVAEDPRAIDLAVDHAVTLTVRDSVALFRLAERRDGPYQPLGAITGPSDRRLRIGVAPDPITDAVLDPEVGDELERTARLCERLGHDVVDVRLPFDGERFMDRFLLVWAGGAAAFADAASDFSGQPVGPDILEPWTLGLAEMFMARQDALPAAIDGLKAFETQYNAIFDEIDVLLTPTLTRPADPIGYQSPTLPFETAMERVTSFAAYTGLMNVAGAASMSVPLGMSRAGLPIGSMFSAKQGDDGLLFALAYELERARPWFDKTPQLLA